MTDRVSGISTPVAADRNTLRDRFGRPLRDLRISVMDRCNFRCPYCMPAETYSDQFRFLDRHQRLSFSEIVRLARLFAGLGVTRIRLTGGEPLLRRGLERLVAELSRIDGIEEIALTTNGMLLKEQAAALGEAGLKRVTVSLDSIDTETFLRMTGGHGLPGTVLEGIAAARDAGLTPIKVNTVVQRGINDHRVMELLGHFRHTGVIVRLIEYMDVGTLNQWSGHHTVRSSELLQQISRRWPLEATEPNFQGEVASRYQYLDGGGEIGFISSVSAPFCGDCSRARISSDGQLYTCLFAGKGTDLRLLLRSGVEDEELAELIVRSWQWRQDRYSEQREQNSSSPATGERIEMFYIGG